ncbi:MAG: cytochrome B [Mucilaginibacter sp.]
MDAYNIIQHLHSGFRYVVLVLLILAIIQSLIGWINKSPYTEGNRKINLFTLISVHTQLLIGIVLYIISPMVRFNSETMKNSTLRYFAVEHWVGMVIAIVLITIGHSKSKKIVLPEVKHKTIALYYLIALLIVVGTLAAGHIPILK